MQIRPLAGDDTDGLRAFYDVTWRAEMDDGRDWNGHWTFDEVVSMLRDRTAEHQVLALAAYDGPALVGAGSRMFCLLDNPEKANVFPPFAPPSAARGLGGALREALGARSRAPAPATV